MKSENQYLVMEDGKKYVINVDKFIDYCSKSTNEKITESAISEIYKLTTDNELKMVQKQMDEHKSSAGVIKGGDNLRYDFLNGLFEVIMGMGVLTTEGRIVKNTFLDEISVGESLAWNTMLYLGFIEEVK